MKKITALLLSLTSLSYAHYCGPQGCSIDDEFEETIPLLYDLTPEILHTDISAFYDCKKINDVAHYKNADWSNAVGITKGISVSDACKIARDNPLITYFFYTKGHQMVLETEDGGYRVFNHGDAVFFKGTPWWGSAPGLADGYVKNN